MRKFDMSPYGWYHVDAKTKERTLRDGALQLWIF